MRRVRRYIYLHYREKTDLPWGASPKVMNTQTTSSYGNSWVIWHGTRHVQQRTILSLTFPVFPLSTSFPSWTLISQLERHFSEKTFQIDLLEGFLKRTDCYRKINSTSTKRKFELPSHLIQFLFKIETLSTQISRLKYISQTWYSDNFF